jgi:hypothetical protein
LAKIGVFLGKNCVFWKVFFTNFSHTVQKSASSKVKTNREKTEFLRRWCDLQGRENLRLSGGGVANRPRFCAVVPNVVCSLREQFPLAEREDYESLPNSPSFAQPPRRAEALSTAFRARRKKSEGELNFRQKSRFLREKPTKVALLKYRLSSALLDSEGEICVKLGGESA